MGRVRTAVCVAVAAVAVAPSASATDIYSVRADGRGLRNLTRSIDSESRLSVSRDGRWIAFIRTRASISDIYIVGAHGGSTRRMTHNLADAIIDDWTTISWSADNRRIAFDAAMEVPDSCALACVSFAIYDLDVSDGTGSSFGGGAFPAWAPVGNVLAFAEQTDPFGQGFQVIAGASPVAPYETDCSQSLAWWRGRVVFARSSRGECRVFAGAHEQTVDVLARGSVFAASSDGRSLAVVNASGVFVIGPRDGARRVARVAADELAWSLDRKRLAFVRRRTLYVLDVTSGRVQRVRSAVAPGPVGWTADGHIVFAARGARALADRASSPTAG